MRRFIKLSPLWRAVGVIGVVSAVATGVTFAALNSQATLADSSISTGSASLQVWNGSAFASSGPGFTITGLVPGTGSGPEPFYLQNNGTIPLTISAHVPVAPTAIGFTDWSNVLITFTDSTNTNNVVNTNMQDLLNGDVTLPGAPLAAGAQGSNTTTVPGNYTATFDINSSAITGSQASVGSFDIVLTGTQST